MAKITLQCPSCGGQVTLGDIQCSHCGMNLKSGESYETQVKKARGKVAHGEKLAAPIVLGVALAGLLFLFSGYQYQKRMEQAVRDRPDLFKPAVAELEQIDDLIYAGKAGNSAAYAEARDRVQGLIAALDKEIDSIKPPAPGERETQNPYSVQQKKYNKGAVKSLLKTLRAKAERRQSQIPA